jgi:hypothetical protein
VIPLNAKNIAALNFCENLANGNRGVKAFLVANMTGCTCCRDENFYSGPYRTKEEAEAVMVDHRKRSLLASQFAREGRYHITECHVLEYENLLVIDGETVNRGGWNQHNLDIGYTP